MKTHARQSSPSKTEELEAKIAHWFDFSEKNNLAEIELEEKISSLIKDYLSSLNSSSSSTPQSLAEKFWESDISVEPGDIDSYIDYLADQVVRDSPHIASPHCLGHMTTTPPYFLLPLGRLIAVMNQNLMKVETSKALSPYERQALAMIHRLVYDFSPEFYYQHIQESESTLGIVVSGGTLANLTAMWCARNTALGAQAGFAGVEREGLPAALKFYGYEGAVIIGSQLMHYSFEKAAGLLGIGEDHLIKVPCDDNYRVDMEALRAAIADCRARKQCILALVGVAGTTEVGSIDPLQEIATLAQEANIHFHVDAAWGGPILFSECHRPKLLGIEQADSVTIDGHKQLYLPTGIGMLLLRHPKTAQVIEKQARYAIRKGSFDLGKRSLEGSRAGTIIFLHAALKVFGKKGYECLINAGIRKAQYMAKSIEQRPEFELLVDPEINIVLYRYLLPSYREAAALGQLTAHDQQSINQFNQRLQQAQYLAGRTFVSHTTIARDREQTPIVALRAVLSNPRITEADIDFILADQHQIATQLLADEDIR